MNAEEQDIENRVSEAKRLAREAGVKSWAVMETNIKMSLKQKLKNEVYISNERQQYQRVHEILLNWYLNVKYFL